MALRMVVFVGALICGTQLLGSRFSFADGTGVIPATSCARKLIKIEGNAFSKFEIAMLCRGSNGGKVEDIAKCVKQAAREDGLELTKMWTSQLCGRDGSLERISCFKEAIGSSVGMNRQEALELCRP